MTYASARQIDAAEIPLIDVSALVAGDDPAETARVADELTRAAEGIGFFYVINHGVPQDLIDRVFATGRAFFAAPADQKRGVAVNGWHHGFIRTGEATMYEGARPDLKESFVWGLDVEAGDPDCQAGVRLIGPNRWPDFMPEMRAVMMDYWHACNRLGARLLEAFAVAMGAPPDRFVERFDRPVSRGSLVWYPPQDATLGEEQFGVAPHTDYGTLTFVCQDDVGGLQVQGREGEWLTAHPIPGSFVVNVGDLLARWTNARFASTPHRVVNSSGRERLSVAMFVDPNHDTVVHPVTTAPGEKPLYPPATVGDYIAGRYDSSFSYRRKQAGQSS